LITPPVLRPYSAWYAAGLDLHLLNELVVDVLTLKPLDDVRRVDAVDQEQVLGGRRAVDRQGE
jgi:hypothetical protein